jgi:hypothetical protein
MVVRPELNANLLRVETRTSPDSGIPTSSSGKPETTTWTGASAVVGVREQIIEVAAADA